MSVPNVKSQVAIGMALGLLVSALIFAWLRSPQLGAAITAYALLQIAYNLRLKRMVILDIGAIATGFVLRVTPTLSVGSEREQESCFSSGIFAFTEMLPGLLSYTLRKTLLWWGCTRWV